MLIVGPAAALAVSRAAEQLPGRRFLFFQRRRAFCDLEDTLGVVARLRFTHRQMPLQRRPGRPASVAHDPAVRPGFPTVYSIGTHEELALRLE